MFRIITSVVILGLRTISSASAQAVIKILEFDTNTGIIDRGEQDGIRVGDVFEVNRYSGDFVYWVGRVEVMLVKPKAAGVKVLERAANAAFMKGDVLELRKREYDPLQDKLNHPANAEAGMESGKVKVEEAAKPAALSSMRNGRPLQFGLTGGLSVPITNASESLGQNLSLRLINGGNEVVGVVDMTHSYISSLAFQGYCALPLSAKTSVNLNLSYIPLNIKSDIESSLLDLSLKASASLLTISGLLNYRWSDRWQFGAGIGIFMPKLTVSGSGNSLTVSDRHFGCAASAAYFLPLGSRFALRSILEYNVFFDDGPSIHSLIFQTGPSFTLER